MEAIQTLMHFVNNLQNDLLQKNTVTFKTVIVV